ncbi:MAG: hypothetical protein OJF51_001541 [Nitrospira sp.]|jgi:MFS family permease|nr:MAG: hypothetical protein OJF51_001541 [Nitrospira sp.]
MLARSWKVQLTEGSIERGLMVFFGLVYFAQGLLCGLLAQPFTYYLKSQGMAANTVTVFAAVAALPWMIKPLYGLLTDLVPLWGYRRKTYLMVTAGFATIGLLGLIQCASPDVMVWALLVATLGIAATDVVVDALMVEQGLRLGRVKQFQGQQWLWLNVAAIMAALLGGWLSQALDPAEAVHTAAMIVIGAPAAVMLAALFLVKEDKVALDPARMRRTAWKIGTALKSRALWTVAGFLAFWNLIPNFSTPLYYHLTDHLRFDQYFIGQLVSIGSIGAVLGALIYRRYLADRLSTQHLVALSIALNTILALGYLWLNGSTAVVLYFFGGIVSMIALLTLFSLAASVCPPQAAGFAFASLMAIHSVTTHLSAMIGGHLYESIFDHQLRPLIILAAAVTLAAFFWIPFLPAESNSRGEFEAGREYVTS